MLVTEKKFQNEDGSIGYYEAVYDSSNILQSTYFPEQRRLYISFNRGGVYSYENISLDMYAKFKANESQGKFFAKEIKSKPNEYPYRKEFTLYPQEVKDLKEVVEKNKEEEEEMVLEEVDPKEILDAPMISLNDSNLETNNMVFQIGGREYIRLNEKGFYWVGILVEEDKEIYKKFKEWVDHAWDHEFNENKND